MISVLNILHVLPTDKFSGAEKVAAQICLNIDKNEFNTFTICNGGSLIEKYRSEGLKSCKLNVNKINILNLIRFKNYCIDNKIDIVHAHGFRASLFALVAKKIFLKRLVVISHVHECSEWLKRDTFVRRIDRATRNSFSINIMCGEKVFEHYLKYGDYINRSKVRTLSNAIETINPASIDTANSQLRQGNEFIFGFIGRLAHRKGLIPFFKKILEKEGILQNAKIVLAGEGEQEEELRKIVLDGGLSDKVLFLGHQKDVYTYLVQFDLFILPSIVEGLPMVVLESMSVGKPVLAFNVGSMSEVVKDNETGFLIAPQDYETFFKIMGKVKTEKDKLGEMGRNAKLLIDSKFCIGKYIKSIESIYFELIR